MDVLRMDICRQLDSNFSVVVLVLGIDAEFGKMHSTPVTNTTDFDFFCSCL